MAQMQNDYEFQVAVKMALLQSREHCGSIVGLGVGGETIVSAVPGYFQQDAGLPLADEELWTWECGPLRF